MDVCSICFIHFIKLINATNSHVGVGNVLAATLGIVTPFCSCSAVPLFIGFLSAGVPLGVTFSLLICVDEVLLNRREDSERIKNLSTARSYKAEAKGRASRGDVLLPDLGADGQ